MAPQISLFTSYNLLHNDETYRHFLHSVYNTASKPTVIRIPVIIVFRNIICFSCSTYASSQFGGNVGGLYVKPIPLCNGGNVNTLTPPILLFGVTILYSSITAELRIMLSKMHV